MINQCTQIFLKFDWMTFNFPDSKLEILCIAQLFYSYASLCSMFNSKIQEKTGTLPKALDTNHSTTTKNYTSKLDEILK